jgi:hypothetical protein
VDKRNTVFNAYFSSINTHYFKPLIKDTTGLFPWFFPLATTANPAQTVYKLRSCGIEAGLWHGSNIIILPLHQYLSAEDVNRVALTVNTLYK